MVRITGGSHGRAYCVAFVVGLLLWVVGVLDPLRGMPLLSIAVLAAGSLQSVGAAYLLLASRPSGTRDHSARQSLVFCLTFAAGVAAIGFAISPVTTWLSPAIIFALGGLALIAWSPQAFTRHRS